MGAEGRSGAPVPVLLFVRFLAFPYLVSSSPSRPGARSDGGKKEEALGWCREREAGGACDWPTTGDSRLTPSPGYCTAACRGWPLGGALGQWLSGIPRGAERSHERGRRTPYGTVY